MPKINQAGQPSYGGVSGQVTNATGQQFELDPNKNLDGTEPEGATPEDERASLVSLDSPEQLTPSANTDAAAAGDPDAKPDDEDGQPVDEPADGDEKDGDLWDPAKPKPAGNQTPAFLPEKKTPAKKK